MNFTFQGEYPVGTGMSTPPKQLIMSSVRRGPSLPKHVLLAMRLSAFILLALGIQVSAATYSQTVSFTGKNVALKTVFASVKSQTGYGLFYGNGEGEEATLRSSVPVTLDLKNVSLELFLKVCLKDQPLEYTLEGKTIFIKKKEAPIVNIGSSLEPPVSEIKGRVININGEPLANANIIIKRTNKGTITNANGQFILKNISSDDIIIVSFIGYKAKSQKVGDQKDFTLILDVTTNELDETVVQAYGNTSRRLNTGNISKVSATDIEQQPVSNPLAALEGRVPGMVVTQANGLPGSSFKVQIRGQNSIAQGSDPLFVIDGVPFATNNNPLSQISSALNANDIGGVSPFNSINPGDIESIEVLKDADATSIYGSRGANGVVLITTKKGKAGKTQFSVNAYSGISHIQNAPKMLNTQQYLRMRHEAFVNDNKTPTQTTAPDLLVFDTTLYTDFRKLLIGNNANITDAQGSLSGGNSNTTFLFGGGYHHETTVFPGDMADNRGSFHININHVSTDHKFTANLTVNYSSDKNNLTSTDLTKSLTLIPDLPALRDSVGNLVWSKSGVYFNNPLSYLKATYTAETDNLISNLQINYRIFPGLMLRTSFGYNKVQDNELSLDPISAQNPVNHPTGISQFGSGTAKTWIIEPQAEYTSNIANGKFNVLVGGAWQEQTNNGNSQTGTGYTNDYLLQSINSAPSLYGTNTYNEYHYQAFFTRLNYTFQDKYILNLSARRDGSSRFGPGRQFGNFGAIGAAWIFSNENWAREYMPILSFGKLRASYGTSGNDQIGNYAFLSTWSATQYPYQGIAGLSPTQLANPDYSWEVNHKMEFALEMGIVQDRIFLSSAYFRNRSSNQLLQYILPTQVGFASIPVANFPATVQNSGWEFILNTKNVNSNSFSWNTSFTISIPRNKLIAFPGLATSPYGASLLIGKSLSILDSYHFIGVNPETGILTYQTKNANGLPSYPDDQHFGDNRDPKYYAGFQNTFKYKKWQLSVFFEGRKQIGFSYLKSIYTSKFPGRYSAGTGNVPVDVLSRWQSPGNNASLSQFTQATNTIAGQAISYFQASDGILSDASFIRLKTLSLSYSVPGNLLQKWHSSSVRFYLQGQNLLTITKYKGADPETQSVYTLPPLRTFTGGLQFTF